MKTLDQERPSSIRDSESRLPANALPVDSTGARRDIFAGGPPEVTYLPVPLWSWNERMDADETGRQTRELWENHVAGGFIHVRKGLLDPYMGPAFMAAVDAVADDCKANDRPFWIYDEANYPSGFGGGLVTRRDVRFRHKGLVARPVGQKPPPGCEPVVPPRDGLQIYRWVSPLGFPNFNGACYADTLNAEAIDAFIEECYQPYIDRYGARADGSPVVTAFFTDEPIALTHANAPHGAVPWTDRLPEEFLAEHGYSPLPFLSHLFVDGAEAGAFRLHFYRTVDRLFRDNFTRRLAGWCLARGIHFTGHFDCEDILYKQQLRAVNVMAQYRHMSIPGIDHLALQVAERVTAKQCQSIVNQFQKKRMMSETGGCGGHGMSFADRWWIFSQQIALGVNLVVPHLCSYTLAGSRKRDWPPSLFEQQPWWPGQSALSDRIELACRLMAEGTFEAGILVLHPRESAAFAWEASTDVNSAMSAPGPDYEPSAPGVRERILPVHDQLWEVTDILLGHHLPFDFGDESVMEESAELAPSGEIRIGAMSYRAVVVPRHLTLRPSTVRLLESFVLRGGRVFATHEPAGLIDGRPEPLPEALRAAMPVVAPADLPAALAAAGHSAAIETLEPSLRPWVLSHVRRLEDGSLRVFVVNLNRLEPATVRLKTGGAVGELDLSDGSLRACDGAPEFSLSPGEDRMFLVGGAATAACAAKLAPRSRPEEIEPASLVRLDENALPLDMVCWREHDGDWSARPVYILAVQARLKALSFRGGLCVRYAFQIDGLGADREVALVVENAGNFRIRVNGNLAAWDGRSRWRDCRWHRIDIRRFVREGGNVVELEADDFHSETMEIDAAFLIGDFHVRSEQVARPTPEDWVANGMPGPVLRCVKPDSLAVIEPRELCPGEISSQGLPFYAGRIAATFPVPGCAAALLGCDWPEMAVSRIAANGNSRWVWAPHQRGLDWRRGDGEIQIIGHGDLRNLLGPHHSIRSDRISMSGIEYEMAPPCGWTVEELPLRWAAGEIPDTWRPDYCIRRIRSGKLLLTDSYGPTESRDTGLIARIRSSPTSTARPKRNARMKKHPHQHGSGVDAIAALIAPLNRNLLFKQLLASGLGGGVIGGANQGAVELTPLDLSHSNKITVGFSLVEVVLALGVLSFVAVVIMGLIPSGLASAQRSSHSTVATRLAAEVQSELQQVGLASFATNTTSFDADGRIVRDLSGATVADTPPVYDVYRSVQSCPLPGTNTGALQRVVVQVVKNPGQQSLPRANGLVTVPAGMEERSYQFHVVQ